METLWRDRHPALLTPGFSRLDIAHIPVAEIAGLFREFRDFMYVCKFSNCMHIKESGCAVKGAVGVDIHPERYSSYVRIMKNKLSE